jgi:hypothetical protein
VLVAAIVGDTSVVEVTELGKLKAGIDGASLTAV